MENSEKNASFEAMILAKCKENAEIYDSDNGERVRQAVTLEYRFRGNYFGTFNNLKNRKFEFVGRLGKGLVTYPVIPRAIRAKTATSIGTNIKLDIQAARNLPEIEAGTDLAANIYNRTESNIYDEDFQLNTAHLRQTQRLIYYRLFNNPNKGIKFDAQEQSGEIIKKQIHGRIFACGECGAEMPEENLEESSEVVPESPLAEAAEMSEIGEPQLEAQTAQPKCPVPDCGGTLALLKDALEKEINPFRTVKRRTGEPDIEVISALLTRIDDLSCVGLQFDRAKWFNVNRLVPSYELKAKYRAKKENLAGANFEKWSVGTHWWYALTKEEGNYHNAANLSDGYKKGLRLLNEEQTWFFAPEACEDWKSPDVWELFATNAEKPDFTFQADETIEQALKRNFEENPENEGKEFEFRGLCVKIANDQVLCVENRDFRNPSENSHECFGVIGWQINPSSYFPLGEERLLNLQDAITNVLSMIYSAGLKRQLAPLFKNGNFIDDDDVKKNHTGGIINVKQETGLSLEQINWRNQIFYLDPPALDQLVWQLAELIIQIQKEESGVYDETVGQVNSQNQTATGRLQAVNQSLSLMLPPSKSERKGKVELIKKTLKLWQLMDDAAFQMIQGTFNEEWKSQDVMSFKKLDVDSDLLFKVVEGSDVPTANPDKQSQLMTVYQLGLLAPDNPMPTTFVVKLLRTLGVEFDVKNSEATSRLATKRLQIIKKKIIDVNPADAFVIIQEPIGEPDANGQVQTVSRKMLNPQLLMDIMSDIRLQVHQTENHQTAMEYYADNINGEIGRDIPNEVLLYLLDEMVKQHLNVLNNMMAKEAATQGHIKATGAATAEETHRALTGADEKEAAMMEQQAAEADRAAQMEEENRTREKADASEKESREQMNREADRNLDLQKTMINAASKKGGKRDDYE